MYYAPFSRILVAASDGNKSAARDHSGAAVDYVIRPAADEILEVERLLVTIQDAGNLVNGKYGDNTAALLTNGIIVARKNSNGILEDYTDGEPIKANEHWGRYCYDYTTLEANSAPIGNVRWTFGKSGSPVRLTGADGEYLAITLEDDFSILVTHKFLVQGIIIAGDEGFATDSEA
jgi:hypothetical protein